MGYHGSINTLRPRQNGRHFADDIFKRIFLNENVRILIKISLKFVPEGPINNIPGLVQIMAWRRPGDKPLSKPAIRLPTDICVARPQWVKLIPLNMSNHCNSFQLLTCWIVSKITKFIYSYFKSDLGFGLTQVDEEIDCPTQPIPCLLMLWWLWEPRHQQAWCWLNKL